MKKVIGLMLVLISFMVTMNVNAAYIPTASSGIDYSTCIAFADGFVNITNSVGSRYYKYCYRASCQPSGVWNRTDMTNSNGFRCQNGNGNPYRKVTSDGCSRYSGTCSNKYDGAYCTKVEFVDCNKLSNGQVYINPNTTPIQTTTTRKTTTRKPTTRKTTIKKTTTKRPNRTTLAPFTNPSKTTTTTTKTTKTTTTTVSNNTKIKKIEVGGTDIKYKDTKDAYSIKLPFDVADIEVSVELADKNSKYEVIGNTGMPNEEHEIKIIVTAPSGATKEVILKVKRYTSESSDCTLANIFSEEYPIDFAKNTFEYKLKLPKNVNTLELEVVPSDEQFATYQIEGNEKLKNNSKITINVRAQDGTICKYEIKIKKSSNTWKLILLIVVLVGVLVAASIVLYRYLKKSKGKYKYE